MAAVLMWRLSLLVCFMLFVRGEDSQEDIVSIEDFIDLDDATPSSDREDVVLTSHTETDDDTHSSKNVKIGSHSDTVSQVKHNKAGESSKHVEVTSDDDDDVDMSGDGSGSGDGLLIDTDVTPLTTIQTNTTSMSPDVGAETNSTEDTVLEDLMEGGELVTESSVTSSDDKLPVSDVVYTADIWPPKPVDVRKQQKKVHSQRWSSWIRTNDTTEVRVRTCAGTTEACNGTEAELRCCDGSSQACEVIKAVVKMEDNVAEVACGDNEPLEVTDEVIQPVHTTTREPAPTQPKAHLKLEQPDLAPCTYSLYDVKRGKYLAVQWSLSRLVTQAKVRTWCSMNHDYLIFHPPHKHCQRHFRDLCHVVARCKGRRNPPKAAQGDAANDCWRRHVYGGELPRGVSAPVSRSYLLCQRFAAMSALGKRGGHRKSHLVTHYDTRNRAPVFSAVSLSQLGDLAWPNTPYFIEHGLIEDAEDTAWFLRKPKKGLVQLQEVGQCREQYSCQLGAHQALPADYSSTLYRVAPLLWPELAGPDPLAQTATFTLTNSAPMHELLYPVWHRAVMHVRQFAQRQCGLPVLSAQEFVSQSYYASLGLKSSPEGPALYVVSGVVPSRAPMETIGNDINVPFMFWMAACCVAPNVSSSDAAKNINNDSDDFNSGAMHTHLSFAMHARNTESGPGRQQEGEEGDGEVGQVVSAPVEQLEQLLQNAYHRSSTDGVILFPASHSACSHPASDFSTRIRL